MDMRSGLAKAKGLGSAKEGSHHWIMQRITAVALIPLAVWFVVCVIKATSHHGIEGVIYMLSSPLNAILMLLLLFFGLYHGALGLQVVIEDYVHCRCGKAALNFINKVFAFVTVVAATVAILYVHISSYGHPHKYQAGFWQKTENCCKRGDCHRKKEGRKPDCHGVNKKEASAYDEDGNHYKKRKRHHRAKRHRPEEIANEAKAVEPLGAVEADE